MADKKNGLLGNLIITTRKKFEGMVDSQNTVLLQRMKELEDRIESGNGAPVLNLSDLKAVQSFSEMIQEEMAQYSDFVYNLDGGSFKKIAIESLSESIEDFSEEEHKDIVEHTARLWALSFGAFGLFSNSDFDLTREQVFGAQRQSEMRYALDPHAGSIIDNLRSYILGRGVKIKTNSPELNRYIMEVYWNFNSMENFHKERFLKFLLRGEHFNRYKERMLEDKDEWKGFRFVVLEIPSPEVMEVEYRENRFPMAYLRDFVDDKENEKNKAYPDIDIERYVKEMGLTSSSYFKFNGDDEDVSLPAKSPGGFDKMYEPIQDEHVMYMKLGHGRRGRPFLLRVLRYLQYYEDFVRDTVRLWHEQARVIMIVYNDKDRSNVGKVFPAPAGGMALVGVKDEIDYKFMSPEINGSAAKDMARIIRLSISAGARSPEIIIFYDASSTVYASINASNNPYLNTVVDFQDMHQEFLLQEIKYCIRCGIKNGALPEKLKVPTFDKDAAFEMQSIFDEAIEAIRSGDYVNIDEAEDKLKEIFGQGETEDVMTMDIPVEVIHPEVKDEDEKKQADALKIHQDMGWASRFTLSAKLGYDPTKELGNILREEQLRAAKIQREMDKISQGRGVGDTGKNKQDDNQDQD